MVPRRRDDGVRKDSNLHPVNPDQALNLVSRVSDTSRTCASVRTNTDLDATADWTIWMLPRVGDSMALGGALRHARLGIRSRGQLAAALGGGRF